MDFSIPRLHHCFWSLPRAISSADLTAPVVSAWLATSCLGASPWPPLGSVPKLHILLVLPPPDLAAVLQVGSHQGRGGGSPPSTEHVLCMIAPGEAQLASALGSRGQPEAAAAQQVCQWWNSG